MSRFRSKVEGLASSAEDLRFIGMAADMLLDSCGKTCHSCILSQPRNTIGSTIQIRFRCLLEVARRK